MKMKLISPKFNKREKELFSEFVAQVIAVPVSENEVGVLLTRVGHNGGWPLLREMAQTELEINHCLKNGASDFEIDCLKGSIHLQSLRFRACIRDSWTEV